MEENPISARIHRDFSAICSTRVLSWRGDYEVTNAISIDVPCAGNTMAEILIGFRAEKVVKDLAIEPGEDQGPTSISDSTGMVPLHTHDEVVEPILVDITEAIHREAEPVQRGRPRQIVNRRPISTRDNLHETGPPVPREALGAPTMKSG